MPPSGLIERILLIIILPEYHLIVSKGGAETEPPFFSAISEIINENYPVGSISNMRNTVPHIWRMLHILFRVFLSSLF